VEPRPFNPVSAHLREIARRLAEALITEIYPWPDLHTSIASVLSGEDCRTYRFGGTDSVTPRLARRSTTLMGLASSNYNSTESIAISSFSTGSLLMAASGAAAAAADDKAKADAKKYAGARWLAGGLFAAALVLSLILIVTGWQYSKPIISAAGLAIAIGSAVLFLAAILVDKDANYPSELLMQFLRDDKEFPSLSRLQFFAWTSVVIFTFAWITFIRTFSGVPPFPGAIPDNVLAIMGISTGAALASTQVEKLNPASPTRKQMEDNTQWFDWGTLVDEFTEDTTDKDADPKPWNMRPSLGRFQMLAWTIISIGVYVAILLQSVYKVWIGGGAGTLAVPDLDSTLVVLMGLSQAGFVGSKAIALTSK